MFPQLSLLVSHRTDSFLSLPLALAFSIYNKQLIPSSTGAPQPDGTLNKADIMKIRHYRQIYVNRSDPIVFLPITVSTSGPVCEDFTPLLFFHTHREASILTGELPEESEQFRF